MVDEGTIRATVIQESDWTEEIERQEYYIFDNFGQGLFFRLGKVNQLTIIGDN